MRPIKKIAFNCVKCSEQNKNGKVNANVQLNLKRNLHHTYYNISSNHHQPSIDARGTIPLSGNEAAVGQVGATNLTPDLTKRQKKKIRMTVSLLKERINAIR